MPSSYQSDPSATPFRNVPYRRLRESYLRMQITAFPVRPAPASVAAASVTAALTYNELIEQAVLEFSENTDRNRGACSL